MIEINIEPELASFGPLLITWHGLFAAIGIALGVLLVVLELRRKELTRVDVAEAALWVLPAAVVGARLAHVIDHSSYYLANPLAILAITEGGLAIFGGIVGGLIGGAIYMRIRALPFWAIVDAAVPAMLIGQSVGRIGCLINGDAWGAPTNLPWAVVYTHPAASLPPDLLGVGTHPYPVYEITWNLALLAALWPLRRSRLPDGTMFCLYAVGYSLGRLVLSVVRQETAVWWNLQQAQVIAIIVMVIALTALISRMSRTSSLDHKVSSQPPDD
ncbi:MAG: prolipoprotein diacylglyceryl transferase [Chloroflexota bacterium]